MNIRTKKGLTLVEMIATLAIAVVVISAGIALYMVSSSGFSSGSDDFDGNMQASVFKSFLDETLHGATSLSFTSAPASCDALTYQSGTLVFIRNYGKSGAYSVKIQDISQISFTVDLSGQRCRLSYTATLSGEHTVSTYSGSFMLLSIGSTAFSAANGGAVLPASYVMSASNSTVCYIGK